MSARTADYRKRCEARPFHMYCIAKRGECKTKGLEFDLDAEYLEGLWTGICPALGVELGVPMKDARGKGSHNTAHLDRFKPELGYVRGNVAWLSGRANRIKYDATVYELEKILDWMKRATTIPEGSTPQAYGGGKGEST